MMLRASASVVSFAAVCGLSGSLLAQAAKAPTLEDVLQRLDANLKRYDSSVPSLFCDEHVVSHVEPGQRRQNVTTDSVFRLKRTTDADKSTILVESREIKTVDGKPSTSKDLQGPSVLSGAFEGGLAVVSLSQRSCMKYSLQRAKPNRSGEPLVVRFATVLTAQNSGDCLLQEKSTGFVSVDPTSMEIMHLELTTPRHTIIPGDAYSSAVVGKRVVTVDYAPVLLDEETFWMPAAIKSVDIGDPGTFHTTVWSFQASYSNYHKMKVTTRILPSGETSLR